jgi:hypothetical protein
MLLQIARLFLPRLDVVVVSVSSLCLPREPTRQSNDVNICPWLENRSWRFLAPGGALMWA